MKKEQISLSNADVRELRAMYRDVREYRNLRSGRKPELVLPEHGSRVFIAKVVSTNGIPIASSPTTPGVGQIAIRKLFWEPADSDSTPNPEEDTTRYIRGIDGLEEESTNDYVRPCYNLSEELSFELDEYVLVILLANGHYVVIDTPKFSREGIPGVSSGSCGCFCIDAGDVEVDGIETTSQFTVILPQVTEVQLNGIIYLPTNRHVLVLNEGSASGSVAGDVGNWFKDVSDELVAEYNSGADATTATNPTGNIEFDRSVSGYTKMILSIYGTVPDESDSGP